MEQRKIQAPHVSPLLRFVGALLMAAPIVTMVVGCSEVERGTGKSLSNANSVIRTGRSKVWGPGEAPSSKRKGRGDIGEEELVQP